jgi:tRNA A-37 threonylcarbamoyl transferase component Bud32
VRAQGRADGEGPARDPRPEPAAFYRMCGQICDGMAFLHKNGIIHRDLKVGNYYSSFYN